MASKFFKAFNFFKKKGTASPTITQPRQLKTTMKRIESENKRFGFTKAKTATDRWRVVRCDWDQSIKAVLGSKYQL